MTDTTEELAARHAMVRCLSMATQHGHLEWPVTVETLERGIDVIDRLEALAAERDGLENQIKALGTIIHKRGNDLAALRRELRQSAAETAALRAENERLREADE